MPITLSELSEMKFCASGYRLEIISSCQCRQPFVLLVTVGILSANAVGSGPLFYSGKSLPFQAVARIDGLSSQPLGTPCQPDGPRLWGSGRLCSHEYVSRRRAACIFLLRNATLQPMETMLHCVFFAKIAAEIYIKLLNKR